MGEFKRAGGFGGKGRGDFKGGGGDFKRGGFGKPRFGNGNQGGFDRGSERRDSDRPEMFDATCSKCGKRCQVPFKPSGDRPIYCKDCFANEMGRDSGRDSGRGDGDAGKRDFGTRTSVKGDRESFAPRTTALDPRIDDMKRELVEMNAKLSKLVELIGGMALTSAVKKATSEKSPTLKAKKKKTK